jgi:hypothetical protein
VEARLGRREWTLSRVGKNEESLILGI